MKRPSWSTLAWVTIVLVLVGIEIGQLVGLVSFEDIIANFFVFVFSLVVIAILAVIGAVFIGMVITHRILAGKEFSPFEGEMMKMAEDVRFIRERLEAMEGAEAGQKKGDD